MAAATKIVVVVVFLLDSAGPARSILRDGFLSHDWFEPIVLFLPKPSRGRIEILGLASK